VEKENLTFAQKVEKNTGFCFDCCFNNRLRLHKKIENCLWVMYVVNEEGPIKISSLFFLQEGGFWQRFQPNPY